MTWNDFQITIDIYLYINKGNNIDGNKEKVEQVVDDFNNVLISALIIDDGCSLEIVIYSNKQK